MKPYFLIPLCDYTILVVKAYERIRLTVSLSHYSLHTLNLYYLQPHLVTDLSLWALCGMGFAMGVWFHLKYVVMYGFNIHIAQTDGVDAPGHPACIARIHLYSDMWRYFDAGMYEYMRE